MATLDADRIGHPFGEAETPPTSAASRAPAAARAGSSGTEVWLPVLGFEGSYRVSSLGNVRRLPDARNPYGKNVAQHPAGAYGHLRVVLCANGKQRVVGVHRLVCEAFHGPCPDGMETRHLDGKAWRNVPDNLEWASHATNMADKRRHGTRSCKLSEHDASQIKKMIVLRGLLPRIVAATYGVSRQTVCNIVFGRLWSDVLPALTRQPRRRAA